MASFRHVTCVDDWDSKSSCIRHKGKCGETGSNNQTLIEVRGWIYGVFTGNFGIYGFGLAFYQFVLISYHFAACKLHPLLQLAVHFWVVVWTMVRCTFSCSHSTLVNQLSPTSDLVTFLVFIARLSKCSILLWYLQPTQVSRPPSVDPLRSPGTSADRYPPPGHHDPLHHPPCDPRNKHNLQHREALRLVLGSILTPVSIYSNEWQDWESAYRRIETPFHAWFTILFGHYYSRIFIFRLLWNIHSSNTTSHGPYSLVGR